MSGQKVVAVGAPEPLNLVELFGVVDRFEAELSTVLYRPWPAQGSDGYEFAVVANSLLVQVTVLKRSMLTCLVEEFKRVSVAEAIERLRRDGGSL